ncbi:MAG TPA: amino acid adenylation domain-containing protein, partial [Thermoanaerobaculia bacterium]|nr:amino acid adenylation domain-containing protein [Thermoanaerobaculia bacterium]
VERSVAMVVAALAVLKAGGALVALDPAYPKERLATIIEDAGLTVLLTDDSLLQQFPRHTGIALCVDAEAEPFPDESSDNPVVGVAPDNPMYAIYTSGSTGQPKGILVPHRAFANLLAWQMEQSRLGPGVKTVQFSTFGFCVSFQEIFSTWCSEGTLVLADEMTRRDMGGLGTFLEAEGIERLHLPYAALKHLAEAASGTAALPSRLREVITAGEQLRVTPTVRELFARLPACSLHNQYGASETHVVSSLALTGDPEAWPAIPAVGRIISNVQIHLLDGMLQPVPVGVRGEMYAGGSCMPRAYLKDPVLTAQKMVPDPYSQAPGARLYRAGDLGRYAADGRIEYLGRIDGQVKVRGFRVELGEVETVLARHPQVRDAAVVAMAAHDGQRLVAYVVPEEEGRLPVDELRAHLKQVLPEHMIPSVFLEMAALPLNANGKLDQAALPRPESFDQKVSTVYMAPRTPAEEVLAGLWAEVLGVERVGTLDSFFELGGHSLLATQVVSRARRVFGIDLPLRALFEAPTVRDLAVRVELLQRRGLKPDAPPLVPLPRTGDLPLSFAQERLWFLDRFEPGTAVYNLPLAIRLEGPLDAAALAASLGEIVRRHEALRTVFPARDGRPVQRVAPAAPFVLPRVDLSGLGPAALAEARRLAAEDAQRPFELDRGPLFRPLLLLLSADGGHHVLLATLHHIVSDGWSMGVFFRELTALYGAFRAGRPSPLAELPVQYADFARWQRQWLAGEALAAEVAYWRRLQDLPPLLDLPTDHPRPGVRRAGGATLSFSLPGDLAAALHELAQGSAATLFMVLLAGYQLLLARLSQQDDLAVGTPIANRNRLEIEGLIGYFVNTLVLRASTAENPRFRQLLEQVRGETLSAYAHQDLPFEKLVDELAPERNLAYTPLFQAMFVFQNVPLDDGADVLPGLALSPFGAPGNTAKFDLTLTLEEKDAGLAGALEYSTDLFEETTMRRLLGHFERLLGRIVAEPEAPVWSLPFLSAQELHQLLAEWSGGGAGGVRAASLPARFAGIVADVPDAVAAVLGDAVLSYGELDRRARRLARRLLAQGVRPGDRVGLCAERGLEMVAAILGILQAGGAYLPLDPAQPRERLLFLLADAQAPFVLAGAAPLTALGGLAGYGGEVLVLERCCLEAEAETDGAEAPWPAVAVAAEWLAYVIYTSGSTGQPKGVVVTHGNVLRLFEATEPWFGFGPSDVWTLFHSYTFDFSVWELWGALLYGGRLVVVPYLVSRSPQDFLRLVESQRVTVLNQTPSAFRNLVAVERETGEHGAGQTLRWVIFGGEALEPRSLGPWFEAHGDERPRLVNMYGITETTVHVTYRPMVRADAESGAGSRIGGPIPDLSVHVLDRFGQPVPIGVAGELYVGGEGVAAGYLERPALTAERFVPDSWGGGAGRRLYRSGDLVLWRATGELEYRGRIDHQVKVRGFRIELGEIESALAQHPGVGEAAVLMRDDGGDQRLVAYVTGAAGAAPRVEELRAHLKERLPEYMVPAAFVELAALPLTPNGKLDRRALPAPGAARPELGEGYVAPR